MVPSVYTSELRVKLAKFEQPFNDLARLSQSLQESYGIPQVFKEAICKLQQSTQDSRKLLKITIDTIEFPYQSLYQQTTRLEQVGEQSAQAQLSRVEAQFQDVA